MEEGVRHANPEPPYPAEFRQHGTFTLSPTPAMRDALRADYVGMAGMIFGEVPPLDAVLASIEEIESRVNG